MKTLETQNAMVIFVPSIQIWNLFFKLHQQNYVVLVLEGFPENATLRKIWDGPLRDVFGF